MHCFRNVFAVICIALLGGAAQASTITAVETYSFQAKVTEAGVRCGPFVSTEVDCDENFGTYSGTQDDDFLAGMSVGGTYNGKVSLLSSNGLIREASCWINGKDCNFGTEFLLYQPAPFGPDSTVEFLDFSVSFLRFDFAGTTGQAAFSTDYIFDADGVHYYAGTTFDLSNVSYSLTQVPLPATLGFLLLAMGSLALFRDRKT